MPNSSVSAPPASPGAISGAAVPVTIHVPAIELDAVKEQGLIGAPSSDQLGERADRMVVQLPSDVLLKSNEAKSPVDPMLRRVGEL